MTDTDLDNLGVDGLKAEVMKLRRAIRQHRDSSGHNLCWYVPELWLTLPEKKLPNPEVPGWCDFMQKCAVFRGTLDGRADVQRMGEGAAQNEIPEAKSAG